jgi:hypothetical protein
MFAVFGSRGEPQSLWKGIPYLGSSFLSKGIHQLVTRSDKTLLLKQRKRRFAEETSVRGGVVRATPETQGEA